MKYQWKKFVSFLLTAVMLGTGAVDHAQAAAPKQKLSQKKLTMSVGDTKKLTVTNKKGCRVSWKSSRGKVASVNKKGKIVAKKAGSVKITATVKNQKTKEKSVLVCRVTVKGKKKPSGADASQSPGVIQTASPTPSAVAPTNLPVSSEAAQTPMPIPSEVVPTSLPVEMDGPSGAPAEGSIDFRGKCFFLGGSNGDEVWTNAQGYAIYNIEELEKVFGKEGEPAKEDGTAGRDVWTKLILDGDYQWMRSFAEPVITRYDAAYFQDKMLYCVIFRAGALYYDIHITDVRLMKNQMGKEELSLSLEFDDENNHLAAEGDYMVFLELNQSDFDRVESARFGDISIENHKVSDMMSVELDGPSEAATAGSIDFRGKCLGYYYGNDNGEIEINEPQEYVISDMQGMDDLKQNVLFPDTELLSPGAHEAMRKKIDPLLSRYQESFFQDKVLYCCLFYAGSSGYKFHFTDVRFVENDAGKKVLSAFLEYDKKLLYPTESGNFISFLELDRKDFEQAEEVEFIFP